MKRSEIREAAFFLLFDKLFTDDNDDEIIDAACEADEYEIDEDVKKLFKNASAKSTELDAIISKYSEKRQLNRIPKISLAILRIALYEIIHDEKVPVNVAISEAVILTKKFAFDADVQFVNGVLGEFSRKMESDKE